MNAKWLARLFFLSQIVLFILAFLGQRIDSSSTVSLSISVSYAVSKAASTMIHINIAIMMFLNTRLFPWLIHETFSFGDIKGCPLWAGRLCFSSTTIWIIFHIGAYSAVPALMSVQHGLSLKSVTLAVFEAGFAWSGLAMVLLLCLSTLLAKLLALNIFSRAWLVQWSINVCTLAFFALLATHEAFCIPDWSGDLFAGGSDIFWKFWLAGALIILAENIVLKLRPQQKARVTKFVQHPNAVLEVQFEKLAFRPKAGQYVILNCPSFSIVEKYRLALTSAPEDDYLSVHIPASEVLSRSLAAVLDLIEPQPEKPAGSYFSFSDSTRPLQCLLHINIDDRFEVTSEALFNAHVAIIVGVSIGVLSLASILKSIWYRMNSPRKATMLQKVYFHWICNDLESFEWFQSLLMAIEAQDVHFQVEIYLYLTAPFDEAKATRNLINNTVHRIDLMTGLRNPSRHGHPDWSQIFSDVAKFHAETKVHVLYSGTYATWE